MKIVIVEGPDGVGKTHIAKGIAENLGIPYFKSQIQRAMMEEVSIVPDQFLHELYHGENRQIELIDQLDLSFVQDRGYPSEWVYSKVFGRKTSPRALRQADEFYARIDARIVIVLRRDYSKARPDDLVQAELLPELDAVYREFINWTKCKVHVLYADDYDCNLDKEMDAILPQIDRQIG